jgi:hypothetical protein
MSASRNRNTISEKPRFILEHHTAGLQPAATRRC